MKKAWHIIKAILLWLVGGVGGLHDGLHYCFGEYL